ncbi:hypothetical protein STENM36S_09591 [Streptomyces tendae]
MPSGLPYMPATRRPVLAATPVPGSPVPGASATNTMVPGASRYGRRLDCPASRTPGAMSGTPKTAWSRSLHRTEPSGVISTTRWRRVAKLRLTADGVGVAERTEFTWDGAVLCRGDHSGGTPAPTRHPHMGSPGAAPHRPDRASRRRRTHTGRDRLPLLRHSDLVGTPTELLDAAGGVAWRTRATVWGKTAWTADGAAYTPLRFPGQYFDPETGLHHNYHRMYDPESGRYLTPTRSASPRLPTRPPTSTIRTPGRTPLVGTSVRGHDPWLPQTDRSPAEQTDTHRRRWQGHHHRQGCALRQPEWRRWAYGPVPRRRRADCRVPDIGGVPRKDQANRCAAGGARSGVQ